MSGAVASGAGPDLPVCVSSSLPPAPAGQQPCSLPLPCCRGATAEIPEEEPGLAELCDLGLDPSGCVVILSDYFCQLPLIKLVQIRLLRQLLFLKNK